MAQGYLFILFLIILLLFFGGGEGVGKFPKKTLQSKNCWLQNKRHDFMEKIVTNNNNTDDKIVGMHPAGGIIN